MSSFLPLEDHTLRRHGHQPPDVYCQHEKQKEDLMVEEFVRNGFRLNKPVADEYKSYKEDSKFFNTKSIWDFVCNVVSYKKSQTLPPEPKRRSYDRVQKTKSIDHFPEAKSNYCLQNINEIVALNKDKEELLTHILSNKFSLSQIAQLINASLAQPPPVLDTSKKKSKVLDQTSEWTSAVCRMIGHLLDPTIDQSVVSHSPPDELDYAFDILLLLYDPDIVDKWEVLLYIVKLIESVTVLSSDALCQSQTHSAEPTGDSITPPSQPNPSPGKTAVVNSFDPAPLVRIRSALHFLHKFSHRLVENELIARRLLHLLCRLLFQLVFSDSRLPQSTVSTNSLQLVTDEYRACCACPIHESLLHSLSSLIIFVTITCPSSVLTMPIAFPNDLVYLCDSPLDSIPFSLTLLPLPIECDSVGLRQCLAGVERQLVERSHLLKLGWNRQASSQLAADANERSVRLLDILDRQDFHVVRDLTPIESLFKAIFDDEAVHFDTAAVILQLCEWAVTKHRVGIHRPVIVACLLEHLTTAFKTDDRTQLVNLLHTTLIDFLDSYTHQLPAFTSEQAPIDNEPMRCLICLFAELIDRELFNHDAYVRRLIARGEIDASQRPLAPPALLDVGQPPSVISVGLATGSSTPNTFSRVPSNLPIPPPPTTQHSVASEMSEDNDRFSVDNPDSVRSESAPTGYCQPKGVQPPIEESRSPHLHYLVHFPLPQDESYAHEQNQRFQLLYGSVRARDRARLGIRKLVRDFTKLFSKKIYLMDVVHGEVCRRRKIKDRSDTSSGTLTIGQNPSTLGSGPSSNSSLPPSVPNINRAPEDSNSTDEMHEAIMSRFSSLSYYDMECVISQCTPVFIRMLNGSGLSMATSNNPSDDPTSIFNPSSPASMGSASIVAQTQSTLSSQTHIYMPVPNSIFLFFDLLEISLNITCLISTVVDTLERLQVLFTHRTNYMNLYMSNVCLRSIGILQRYQSVLLLMNSGDLSVRLFPILISQVRKVKEPTQCSPVERCILTYLNDLFTSSAIVRNNFSASYSKVHQRVAILFRHYDRAHGHNLDQAIGNYGLDLLELGGNSGPDHLTKFRLHVDEMRSSAHARMSFICTALPLICFERNSERLNYACSVCSELTSQASDLAADWLGGFSALLTRNAFPNGYASQLASIQPSQVSMYDNLAALIGTLLSRNCFMFSDFLREVVCPAMARGLAHVQPSLGPNLEPTTRLTCHILHRLFTAELAIGQAQVGNSSAPVSNTTTPNTSISIDLTIPSNSAPADQAPPFRILEPMLLTGALKRAKWEYLVDLLKLLIVHSDKTFQADPETDLNDSTNSGQTVEASDDTHRLAEDSLDFSSDDDLDQDSEDFQDDPPSSYHHRRRGPVGGGRKQTKKRRRLGKHNKANIAAAAATPLSTPRHVHPIVERFLDAQSLPTVGELLSMPLSALLELVVREICTCAWVRQLFLQMLPDILIRENALIDANFSGAQARRLLHIIYSPHDLIWRDVANGGGVEGWTKALSITLTEVDVWVLRQAEMRFVLLHRQLTSSPHSEAVSSLAKLIVQRFQRQSITSLHQTRSSLSVDGLVGPIAGLPRMEVDANDPVWLLPTLVGKLPKVVKHELLRETTEILKGVQSLRKHKNDEDKETVLLRHSIILAHPAFFSLLQACLREASISDALYDQIETFIGGRELEDRVPDNLRTRQIVQECIRLRLSLLGQSLSTIQNDTDAPRWILLLVQLIGHGVVEPESNVTLFDSVHDLVQVLIHSLAARSGLEGKHYQNITKRIRRELADKTPSPGIERLRPLLIPSKLGHGLISSGSMSAIGSTGGLGSGASSINNSTSSHHNKPLGGSKSYCNKPGKVGSSGSSLQSSNSFGSSTGGSSARSHAKKRGYPTTVGKDRLSSGDSESPKKRIFNYGAVSIEAVPLRVEEQATRLFRHEHYVAMHRSPDFYILPIHVTEPSSSVKDAPNKLTQQNDVKSKIAVEDNKIPHELIATTSMSLSTPNSRLANVCAASDYQNYPDSTLRSSQYHEPQGKLAVQNRPNLSGVMPSSQVSSQSMHHQQIYTEYHPQELQPTVRFTTSNKLFTQHHPPQSASVLGPIDHPQLGAIRQPTQLATSRPSRPTEPSSAPKRKRSGARRGGTVTQGRGRGATQASYHPSGQQLARSSIGPDHAPAIPPSYTGSDMSVDQQPTSSQYWNQKPPISSTKRTSSQVTGALRNRLQQHQKQQQQLSQQYHSGGVTSQQQPTFVYRPQHPTQQLPMSSYDSLSHRRGDLSSTAVSDIVAPNTAIICSTSGPGRTNRQDSIIQQSSNVPIHSDEMPNPPPYSTASSSHQRRQLHGVDSQYDSVGGGGMIRRASFGRSTYNADQLMQQQSSHQQAVLLKHPDDPMIGSGSSTVPRSQPRTGHIDPSQYGGGVNNPSFHVNHRQHNQNY